MVIGTCTYNETFFDIFTKKCRFYSFDSCPYLSECSLKSYKITDVLSIYGSRSYAKLIFVSDIIYDLIKTNYLKGKIVLIDTELGFNVDYLTNKLDSSNLNKSGTNQNCSLSNFLYLPARNFEEFNIIIDCLEFCLSDQKLNIHCLIIDSLFGLYKKFITDKQYFYKIIDSKLNQIIELCKKYSIFFIYTRDIESNLDRKYFYVELNTFNASKDDGINILNSQDARLSETPATRFQNDHKLDEILFFNNMLISCESNNSTENKNELWNNNRLDQLQSGKNLFFNIRKFEENNVRIKSSIPRSWITNESNQKRAKHQKSIFISLSRNCGKNYVTFISKDNRNKDKRSSINKNNSQTKEIAEILVHDDSSNDENKKIKKLSINMTPIDISSQKTNISQEMELDDKIKNECVLDEQILCKHEFGVYRIDDQCTYTKCSYNFCNFIK